MLKAHDRVVAGISGGADSVCLLFVLLEWAKRTPLSLAAVHVNHGIRPEAAEDERYVEELCRQQGIPFYPFHTDVRRKAAEEGLSEEEAGRQARYDAFAQAAADFRADHIAVAHNSNDRAETMLFHLFRGSGIRGLGSIRPVRDRIIRPILCLERREAEAYLEARGISFCQDVTNDGDEYTRNRIRHHILPYAEREIASGCVAHMAQTADMLTETEVYLEEQTAKALQSCVRKAAPDYAAHMAQTADRPAERETQWVIETAPFLQQHRVIQQRMLYRLILNLTPYGKDISYGHIRELLSLFTESGNRSICLPFGIVGKRRYDQVVLEGMRGKKPTEGNTTEGNTAEGEIFLPAVNTSGAMPKEGILLQSISMEGGGELTFRLLSRESISADFPQNRYTKWLDYDKIKKSVTLRTRRTGDYLTIAGPNGQVLHKTAKDYMITEKIPREDRDRIWLLAEGPHIIWLMGYRISEYYKINRNTKHVLQVQLTGK